MQLRCCGSGSSGNSYALIADSGEILLIECGVPWKKILKMINFQVSNVVGCIATHKHKDHLLSYKDLLMNGIPIYTNDETAAHFEIVSGEKMIGVPERTPFKEGGFTVIPFYVPHDGCANFAYLIYHPESGHILYATDMSRIAQVDGNYRMKKANGKPVDWSFKNLRLNHLIIESNYDFSDFANIDEFKRSHVGFGHHSLQACKRFIEQNKTPDLRTVTLIHLSQDTDEDNILQQIKEVAGKRVDVAVAHPGLEVKLRRFPF